MNTMILAILIIYPSKLVTLPTAYSPDKYQISFFDAGIRLGNIFIKIDPLLLPAMLNTGVKLSSSGFYLSVSILRFYGNRFVQKESVDRIKLNASGYNICGGYTYKNLTGTVYFRSYGNISSTGILTGAFISPVMVEMGYDSFEQLRFAAGVLLSNGGFFVKIGLSLSTRLLKDAKFYIIPVINMGYRR